MVAAQWLGGFQDLCPAAPGNARTNLVKKKGVKVASMVPLRLGFKISLPRNGAHSS